jgi:hypothetical protein
MKKALTLFTVLTVFVLTFAFAVAAGAGYDDGSSFSGI